MHAHAQHSKNGAQWTKSPRLPTVSCPVRSFPPQSLRRWLCGFLCICQRYNLQTQQCRGAWKMVLCFPVTAATLLCPSSLCRPPIQDSLLDTRLPSWFWFHEFFISFGYYNSFTIIIHMESCSLKIFSLLIYLQVFLHRQDMQDSWFKGWHSRAWCLYWWCWNQTLEVCILSLPLGSSVWPWEGHLLSQFPVLSSGDNSSPYPIGLLWGLNELSI